MRLPSSRSLVRSIALGVLVAMPLYAAEIPGTGGKLDFGIEDIPGLEAVVRNTTPPRTVGLLVAAAYREEAPFRRAQLVMDIGATLLPEAIPALEAFLDDDSTEVRATAAAAIANLASPAPLAKGSREALKGNKTIIEKLASLLQEDAPSVRASSLSALAAIQGVEAPQIAEALTSREPVVFATAIELAGLPQHGDAIASRLDDLPGALRQRGIIAVGRSGAMSQRNLLESLLKSDNVADAVAAANGLELLKSPESLPVLAAVATSAAHPSVRREALEAHSAIAAPDPRIALAVKAIADPDPTVRQFAAKAMGTDLRPDLVPLLVEQLGDEYRPLYLAARAALIAAPNDAARTASISAAGELLDNASPRRREDGSYILGKYRSDHRLERHMELLEFEAEDTDFAVVAQAAQSLGLIGRKEPRAALVKLGQSTGPLAMKPFGPQAVANAIVASGRLGFAEILPVAGRLVAADPLTTDAAQKEASSFAIGMLAEPDDPVTNGLFSSLQNMMDGNKPESVKAIGNLKIPGAAPRIQSFPQSDTPPVKYLIEWATARITGQPEVHKPLEYDWTAQTSIRSADE